MSALEELRRHGPAPALESAALGEWVLDRAGFERRGGLVTVAAVPGLRRVPFARSADWIAVVDGDRVRVLSRQDVTVHEGVNLAGEPRDDVVLGSAAAELGDVLALEELNRRGALVRTVLMAGALDRLAAIAIRHAGERKQFGRPIGAFQAVQTHLVTVAQQAALVGIAADAAVSTSRPFEIAAAKALAGRAAVTAGRAAHQVLGARGVTLEHPLSIETKRLWAWRSEYGDERDWARQIGVGAARRGADELYPTITAGGAQLEV
jgi:acyl-CoA dehydrogenase